MNGLKELSREFALSENANVETFTFLSRQVAFAENSEISLLGCVRAMAADMYR